MKKIFNNPIIENQGVCDPHIHIYHDRAYLFSTHDEGPKNTNYTMNDWRIFSSKDLIHWDLVFTLDPKDTYLKECHECYATDGAERNGKYYFYFSDQQRSTGVAVSETGPEGPYHDALGKPLLPPWFVDTASYDPTVFIDDDENHTPYIIFGYTVVGKDYYIARLNEDMISLAEPPRKIVLIDGWKNDATWLTKRNGVYYLNSHGACYATSDNVYGPYTGGREPFCHDAYVDHGTFFTWHNQTFLAYGVPENWGEEKVDPFYRTTKIIYAHYRDNGDIVTDPFITKVGVGLYDTSWGEIRAAWYFAASDGLVKRDHGDHFEIAGVTDGATLSFPNFSGIREHAQVTFTATATKGGQIEVLAEGKTVGCVTVPDTKGEDLKIPLSLNIGAGTHDITLKFHGEGQDFLRLSALEFAND